MMMYHVPSEADEALKRGLEIARAQGQAALEKEKLEAEERKRQEAAAVDDVLRQAEAQALEMYRQLVPVYARRVLAAAKLEGPLGEFMAAEGEIRKKLDEITSVLSEVRVRFDPLVYRKHVDQLRASAGIPVDHSDVSVGNDLATTICRGLVKGHISPGSIRVGKSTISLK